MVTLDLRPTVGAPAIRKIFGADEMVTVVTADNADAYGDAAALVAVTRHVPAVVAFSELPVIVQPVAVPLVTVYVTAPVPAPPLMPKARAASR
jgi:hypothetical protein